MILKSPTKSLVAFKFEAETRASGSARDSNLHNADLRFISICGCDLTGSNFTRADLRHSDLRSVIFRDSNLRDADLRDADLRYTEFTGADLRGVSYDGVPVIPNIHQAVHAVASQPGALNMRAWHSCKTTHCRAGWVVFLAGNPGRELESRIGTSAAAALIYAASDPTLMIIPDFNATAKDCLQDMRRLASLESIRSIL